MRWSSFAFRRLLEVVQRVIRDTSAVSALEFGLLAPMLIAIPIPVLDIGLGLYSQMQVKEAAQAGAEYALLHGYDSAQIQEAATSATPVSLGAGAVSSQENCGCPNGTSLTLGGAPGSCATCGDGATPGNYVSVTVTTTYTPPVAFPPLIQSSYTLTSKSVLRIP
ncbi:MAG TPA: TadE/TadG family type IV pilus assembly protein [Alphaproteobacteria bacterium]|nr:TadE/TadG family type IV pilus assembly protein [Alphaproteobacteria bacterium]